MQGQAMSHPYLYVHRCKMCAAVKAESGERWKDPDGDVCNECLAVLREEKEQARTARKERKP